MSVECRVANRQDEQSFTAEDAKDAKEQKSLTAKVAKGAKEHNSLTAKDAKNRIIGKSIKQKVAKTTPRSHQDTPSEITRWSKRTIDGCREIAPITHHSNCSDDERR